jgi:DNA-binding NtrC family response regulator
MCVRVVRGAHVGRSSALGTLPLVLGSAPANALCIVDRHVSRKHCELFVRDDAIVVRDLGSTNGTFVDGVRVLEAIVGLDTCLRLGATELGLFETTLPSLKSLGVGVTFGDMVGGSDAAQRLFASLRSIARSSLGCLLLGETGTGKELAARALHEYSGRAKQPFLVVDCASVGAQFIEDKLFGHERGAFTGAIGAVAGVFEEARGGTVFLDEIGELPLALQAKLLGVLERREVTRIGSHTAIKLDVRLLAATHRNLAEMSQLGLFRQDLLYRIAEFTLHIPALRERTEDIPLIAQTLLRREDSDQRLTTDAAAYLQQLQWPGNIRELRNVIRRASALARGPQIDRPLLLALEEGTAQIRIPPSFDLGASATLPIVPPRTDGSRSDTLRAPAGEDDPFISGVVLQRPGANGGTQLGDALTPDFTLPLAEATEAFRTAYVQELRRRFGDDLNGAAMHAGVHPKSVSRLFRLYRAYAR